MGIKTGNFSVIHNNNSVCTLNTGDSLCDDQFCCIWNFFCKCFTNLCIGCGIYGTCTVIKNQNLWLFKKGSCNTKTLLLPTRNIRTTLFDICMITIWHSVNKFIRTGKMAGPLTLFLCCILITPAEVIENCTGEKNIFL